MIPSAASNGLDDFQPLILRYSSAPAITFRSFEYHPFQHSKLDRRGESVMVVSLDLQTFIVRARVLKLYRQALRVVKRAAGHSKGELMKTIRREMENNSNCNGKQKIRYLISEGLERIKDLDEMLDMQGH